MYIHLIFGLKIYQKWSLYVLKLLFFGISKQSNQVLNAALYKKMKVYFVTPCVIFKFFFKLVCLFTSNELCSLVQKGIVECYSKSQNNNNVILYLNPLKTQNPQNTFYKRSSYQLHCIW